MKKPKVVFYKDESGGYRWSLVAANGRKLCTPGESFSSKRKAEDNYRAVLVIMRHEFPRMVYK